MKQPRTRALVVCALVVLLVVVFRILNQDTITKAAQRLGNGFVKNDPDVAWGFISQKERDEYGMNRDKFTTFWKTLIEPTGKELTSMELEPEGPNRVTVVVVNSTRTLGFSLPVSGIPNEFVSPHFFSSCLRGLATQGFVTGDLRTAGPRHFRHMAAWLRAKKSALQAAGISGIKTSDEKGMRSVDEVAVAYEQMAQAQEGSNPSQPQS